MQIILFSAQIKTHGRFEIIFVYHRASNSHFLQTENTNWSFLLKKNRAKVLLTPSFAGTINKKTQRKGPYTMQK